MNFCEFGQHRVEKTTDLTHVDIPNVTFHICDACRLKFAKESGHRQFQTLLQLLQRRVS